MDSIENVLAGAAFRAIAKDLEDEHEVNEDPEVQVQKLMDALKDLQPTQFSKGDIITLKDKNTPYKYPKYGSLAIVSDSTKPLLPSATDRHNSLEREDTIILVSVAGRWVFYSVDSRYFKKFEE